MSGAGPSVLVMAPAGGPPGEELAAALRSEADRWANEVAPGRVRSGDGPLADAIARALAEHDGPLLAIWPVLARFRPEHATGALGDLESGAGLVVGPLIDGGLYLLGLERPLGELVSVPDEVWSGGDAMREGLGAAAEAGIEVGLLRAERALRTPGDVRAALADPLTSPKIVEIVRNRSEP
jgi:hypothetical protein